MIAKRISDLAQKRHASLARYVAKKQGAASAVYVDMENALIQELADIAQAVQELEHTTKYAPIPTPPRAQPLAHMGTAKDGQKMHYRGLRLWIKDEKEQARSLATLEAMRKWPELYEYDKNAKP